MPPHLLQRLPAAGIECASQTIRNVIIWRGVRLSAECGSVAPANGTRIGLFSLEGKPRSRSAWTVANGLRAQGGMSTPRPGLPAARATTRTGRFTASEEWMYVRCGDARRCTGSLLAPFGRARVPPKNPETRDPFAILTSRVRLSLAEPGGESRTLQEADVGTE